MIRKIWFIALACALGACASGPKEVDDRPRVPEEDPTIAVAEQQNYKLYKQTPTQMYRSLKLPSINYDFDSIRPPEYAYPFLDKLVTVMTEKEQLHLVLEGHSDAVGSDEYNYWLSGARAAAMKSYLVSRGINAERIRVHAYGNTRPITLDQSQNGRRANRRVDFKFTTRQWKSIY